MVLSTHLSFNGNCEEAMNFYATTFGGTVRFKMTWAESPMKEQVGPGWQGKMMHMSIVVGQTGLMGADSPPGQFEAAKGTVVSIGVDTPEDADRVFAALGQGGTTQMPIMETFWAKRFGMTTDRFGIPWMVNCEKPMTV